MGRRRAIGLVGCGDWGRYILRDLVSLGCRVAVVARSEQSRARAREGGAAAIVGGIDELPSVDGFVVATPTSTHAAVIEELLPLGVPIFVEKPMCDDAARAARLAELAPDRLFVMDKWRYHPGVELLAAIARSGELGPVLGLRTTRVSWGRPHPDTDAIWTLAPHDLSIALEVLGTIPSPRSALAERVGDDAAGLIGFLGGDPWFVFEVSVRHRERRREVRLHCRDGVAVLSDGYADHVRVTRGSASEGLEVFEQEELRPITGEMPLRRELKAFLDYLGGGPPPRSSAAEGAAAVKVLAETRSLAGLDGARAAT